MQKGTALASFTSRGGVGGGGFGSTVSFYGFCGFGFGVRAPSIAFRGSICCFGGRVRDSGLQFRVPILGFGVSGFGFEISDANVSSDEVHPHLRFQLSVFGFEFSGFQVPDSGFRGAGYEFRVSEFECQRLQRLFGPPPSISALGF